MRPALVLIGGTHGAGKSTLADELSARLGWTLISRDRIRGGIAWTEGETEHVPAGDLSRRAVSLFYEAAHLLVARGASIVLESAFRRGVSEGDVASLVEIADVRYVQCVVPREVAIARCRIRAGREFVGDMLDGRDEARWARVEQPMDIGIEPLVVNTTDGYDPTLNEIEALLKAPVR